MEENPMDREDIHTRWAAAEAIAHEGLPDKRIKIPSSGMFKLFLIVVVVISALCIIVAYGGNGSDSSASAGQQVEETVLQE